MRANEKAEMRKLLIGLALLMSLTTNLPADGRVFAASWHNGAVHLQWRGKSRLLQRSTSSWDPLWLRGARGCGYPVRDIDVQGRDCYVDSHVAAGANYTYALDSGRGALPALVQVSVPPQILPVSRHTQLRVDKTNYALEVWDSARMLKRYPLAMGRTPWKRKLHFDNSSTPEGRYKIIAAQPDATYYKAYDIDYPNRADEARYRILKPSSGIGGEIEIHGQGIDRNWTFGCMAMRNADMDELFAHGEIGVGTVVWIYGGELTLADLQSDVDNPFRPLELGLRQKAQGLKVTCLWDRSTRAKLDHR